MGLQSELDYTYHPARAVQRRIQQAVASRAGAQLCSKALHLIDRPIYKLTNGRQTATSLVGGLPVVMVTTTGRRSGRLHTTPLLALPSGDDLAIVGSNFGQKDTPGWVFNLEADPHAIVAYRDRSVNVTARRADPRETDAAFDEGAKVYPGYASYRDRAAHRDIRVFVLEPRA